MLADQALFDMVKNTGLSRRLGLFGTPGSIPPTVGYGLVNQNPQSYNHVSDPIITSTLKFVTLIDPTYVGPGVVMENTETGARYFMLAEEYCAMMDQAVSDHNRIRGQWDVIKEGHAFSLRWITPMGDQE